MPKHIPKVPKHIWNKVKIPNFLQHFHHIWWWWSSMIIVYDYRLRLWSWVNYQVGKTFEKYKANNQHIAGYDPKSKSTYLLYLDANNLYGWAMVQTLPYKDIKFSNETTSETIWATEDDAATGYMVEVDLSKCHHAPSHWCHERNGSANTKNN